MSADDDDDAGDPGASPRFVLPGLALGGLRCLSSLRRHGFTHVLSVINLPVAIPEKDDEEKGEGEDKGDEGETTKAAGATTTTTAAAAARFAADAAPAAAAIRHARIDLADDEEADLLSHLPFATAWVTEALTPPGGEPEGGGADGDDKRKNKAKVLIHCSAGVSRSAAVAAACLMALNSPPISSSPSSSPPPPPPLSADAAVAAVAAAAPGTAPNRGFLRQLRLFEEMGCRLDARSSAEYRAWRARAMAAGAAAAAAAAGGGVGSSGGSSGERASAGDAAAASAAAAAKDRALHPPLLATYRCRACRRLVATSENAVPATSETGGGPQKMFAGKSWNKAKIGNGRGGGGGGGAGARKAASGGNEEEKEEEEEEEEEEEKGETPPLPLGSDGSSLFVEPLKWMLDALSLESSGGGGKQGKGDGGGGKDEGGGEASKPPPPTKGKLHCPGCSSRLGSFSWAGSQSATGAWIVPAFQLHLSRLDAAEEEEEEEKGEGEGKEREGGGGGGKGGGKGAPSPAPSPAVPPSVASRIRQPRFLK